ncbi:universal stress protein [Natrinema amylolyticum]|uniref:universal stress protein n=1 Tax=Natrinema amylolyticum TaxID=2878679 RepID=UPI001CFAEB4A|nr:universal stress protein [Natrinema amylolyticum]
MALETILLAVGNRDETRVEQLTSTAVELAEPVDALVTVAHVVPAESGTISESALPIAGQHRPTVLSDDEYDDVLDRSEIADADGSDVDDAITRHETVRAVVDRLESSGVTAETRGVIGDSGEALVTLARESDADRIVIGGRHRSPTDKVVFGSVAQDVLLSAPCPVTFVRDA